MAAFSSIAAGVGAIGGAAGGAAGDQSQSTVNLPDKSKLEGFAQGLSQEQLQALENLVGQGPGGEDVGAGAQGQRDFASQLQRASETGFISSQAQKQAGLQAQAFLAPQRTQLQQTFEAEGQRTAQLAAQLGRSVDDPILQAKLSTARLQQEAQLSSQEAGLTQQFGQQQIGLAGQRADVLSGLGQQALQNRLTLFGAGQSALGQQQQFRLGAAGQTQTSGGGLGGAISGGIAGFGAGAGVAGNLARTNFLNRQIGQFESRLGAQGGGGGGAGLAPVGQSNISLGGQSGPFVGPQLPPQFGGGFFGPTNSGRPRGAI